MIDEEIKSLINFLIEEFSHLLNTIPAGVAAEINDIWDESRQEFHGKLVDILTCKRLENEEAKIDEDDIWNIIPTLKCYDEIIP